MASGSGLNVQLMTAEEVTYGTPVTPDRAYEIVNESLERNHTTLQSNGLRAGNRSLRRRGIVSARMGSGGITMEVATKGFGRWFKHILGGTSTIAQQGATPAYLQTHTLGALEGKSLTVQKGVPQTDGTVKPFTFHGCKVLSAGFSISVDAILQMALNLDAEDVDTSTALAAATYTTPKLFHFMQGKLKVAGAEVASVLGAQVNVANTLKTDRFYLGSAGLKKQPIDNDFPAVSGSLSAEFVSQADFYDRYVSDAAASLILEFEGDVISGAEKELLRITVDEVRFTGETPKVGGPEVVVQNIPFDGHYDGTNPGVKIEYKSTDTVI
jgi:hypothetical protein